MVNNYLFNSFIFQGTTFLPPTHPSSSYIPHPERFMLAFLCGHFVNTFIIASVFHIAMMCVFFFYRCICISYCNDVFLPPCNTPKNDLTSGLGLHYILVSKKRKWKNSNLGLPTIKHRAIFLPMQPFHIYSCSWWWILLWFPLCRWENWEPQLQK